MTFRSRFGPPRQLTITRIGWFYVALTVGMGAAGINTGNNLILLTCGLMLGLIVASGVLSERSLRDLEVERELPTQLAVGEPALVTLVLRNEKRFASFGVLISETAGPGRSQFPLVRGGEIERRAYLLTPGQRGPLHFGGLRVATRFPFGLFEKSLVVPFPQEGLVAPAPIAGPLPPEGTRASAGPQGLAGEGQGLDPWELKLHRAGEDVRRIAWAQSARTGKLLALTREREGQAEVALRLQAGLPGAARELHLAQLRHAADRLLAAGASVALTSGHAGELTLIPSGVGPSQRTRILQHLAREPREGEAAAHDTAAELPAAKVAQTVSGSSFLRWQRALLGTAVACAFASVAVSRELPSWLLVTFVLVAVYALPTRERATASFAAAVNGLSLIVLCALAGAIFTHSQSLPLSAAEASLLLCANRLLVRRGPADDALLHLACFLVLAAGAALGSELEFGLSLVAFCGCAAASLTLSELRRGIEEEASEQASALMASPELTAPRLLGFTAALGVGALLFGVALFPLFPRAQLGLLHSLAYGGSGPKTTGVSDRVDLSQGGPTRDSSKLVARLELTAGKPSAAQYLRAVTFNTFTGTGWVPRPQNGRRAGGISLPGTAVLTGILEPMVGPGDFVPVPEGLTDLRPETFGQALLLRDDGLGDLRFLSGPQGLLSAPLAGALAFHFEAGTQRVASEPAALAAGFDTSLPPLSNEVQALAEQLIPEGLALPEALQRLERHFGGWGYTTDTGGGSSPLDDFLRVRKGDCQLFATAAAVLLRARGIPARYVAGYYLRSAQLGENLVRAWDAHAWAEVLTPEGTAALVDLTPAGDRGGHASRASLWQRAADLWDAAQFRWLRTVVDYDQAAQLHQAEWLMGMTRSLWKGKRLWQTPIAHGLMLLALVGLLVELGRRLLGATDPAVALERRLFARLARLGLARGAAMTYEEATAALEAKSPEAARRASPLLRRLGSARFGGVALDAAELRALSRAIDRVR